MNPAVAAPALPVARAGGWWFGKPHTIWGGSTALKKCNFFFSPFEIQVEMNSPCAAF